LPSDIRPFQVHTCLSAVTVRLVLSTAFDRGEKYWKAHPDFDAFTFVSVVSFKSFQAFPVLCRYDKALYCSGSSESRVFDAGKTLLMDMLFAATDGVVKSRRRMHFHAVRGPLNRAGKLTTLRERRVGPHFVKQTATCMETCGKNRRTNSRCFVKRKSDPWWKIGQTRGGGWHHDGLMGPSISLAA
jgi:hypothetical protein